MPPHNLTMTVTGASMLWVGWFGFNAGSALAANNDAGMAMLATHISAAAASLAWMAIEWYRFGKPSVLGIVTGMVAGLGTITPASGFVGPLGALIIGISAGFVCYFTQIARTLKITFPRCLWRWNPRHILAGVFVSAEFGGSGYSRRHHGCTGMDSNSRRFSNVIWCGVMSFVILKL